MAGSGLRLRKAAAAPTDATLAEDRWAGSVVPNGRVWTTGGPPRHAAVVQPLAFPTTKSSNSKPVKAGIRMPCDRSFT